MPKTMMGYSDPYAAEAEDIERRRRYAEMLREQSMQPIVPSTAGRMTAPISWTQGLAKLVQGGLGGYRQQKAEEESKKLSERYRSDLADVLRRGTQAATGTPGSVEAIMDEQARGGEGAPAAIVAPGVEPNPARAAGIYMEHPATQALGLQEMQRQAQLAALRGILPQFSGMPGQMQTPGPAGATPTFSPQGPVNPADPALLNLAMMPGGGAGLAKLISDRQIAGQKIGLDREKMSRAIYEWENLSAMQKADLAQKGIKNALDLAEARDKGIDVSGVQTQPQMPQGPQPAAVGAQTSAGVPPVRVDVTGMSPEAAGAAYGNAARDAGIRYGGAQPAVAAGNLSPQQQRGLAQKREESKIEADSAYTQAAAKGAFERDNSQYDAATSAVENIAKLDTILNHLKTSSAITGMGAELMKDVERMKVFVAQSKAAGKRVSDTELLDAFLGSDVFPMIKALGIGARGLDTPEEREFLRQVMSGTIQMNKDTLLRLTQFRKEIAERAITKFNERVDKGEMDRFFSSSGVAKQRLGAPSAPPRPASSDQGVVIPASADSSADDLVRKYLKR